MDNQTSEKNYIPFLPFFHPIFFLSHFPGTKHSLYISRHVVFDEDAFPFKPTQLPKNSQNLSLS